MAATYSDIRLLEQARKEIGELIDNRTDFISSGSAPDYASYRYHCGEIQGLTTALNIMSEIVRTMGESR